LSLTKGFFLVNAIIYGGRMNKIVRFIYQYQPTKKNYSETSNKKPVLQNGLFVFGSQRGLE